MDLLIPDNWLRDYLKTTASPKELQKFLSLSGPTVDRINGSGKTSVYEIEVTTNRPDAMSIYGIAREAATILPRHKVKAALNSIKVKANQKLVDKVSYLDLQIEKGLAPRSLAILLKEVTIKDSPKFIQERLLQVDERPINNVVDISNYIMHELGQPVHTFDYDKIVGHKMIMRRNKKGEEITTLDGKKYKLPEGGMVIEDGSGDLIDMPGIMGGLNSAIDKNTKNVLLFVQTYNPAIIRKMAMSLDKWSNAARLYEKGLDPEQTELATRRSIDLLMEYANAKPEKQILDLYFAKPEPKAIVINKNFISQLLGIEISQKEVSEILGALEFKVKWSDNTIEVTPPTFRAKDVQIAEDVIEEVARIYGYQNIPGKLMSGVLPALKSDSIFKFENKVKETLKGLGGSEVYTLSLVSKAEAGIKALKVSNPLGGDTGYLRTSLKHSLINAADTNRHWDLPFHLFEMAHIYTAQSSSLPNETMYLSGIFSKYSFREAKGILEVLFEQLNVSETKLLNTLSPIIGTEYLYYEMPVGELWKNCKPYSTFSPIPQFPAQVEDVTLLLSSKTEVGSIIKAILSSGKYVANVELVDIFENSYTFRLWFQSPNKTLTNEEVSASREKLLKDLSTKFGAKLKE